MKLRTMQLLFAGAAALTFATARPAFAGEDGTDDSAEHQDDGDTGDTGAGHTGDHTANTDHADRATMTLLSHASDTAKANAFGQQGARQKAAHAAAKAAAVKEAHAAATAPTLPDQAIAGRAHAHTGGKPASPGSQGQRGLDIAASHGAHGSPTSHPTGKP